MCEQALFVIVNKQNSTFCEQNDPKAENSLLTYNVCNIGILP